MAQTWAANAVVETGTWWSNGANTYSDNGVYATCYSSDVPGTSGYLKLGLPNNSDPLDHTSHILLVNIKHSAGTALQYGSATVTVELRESGTLRASYNFTNPGVTDTDKTYTLSTGEAGAISNYNNLEIWVKVAFTLGESGTRTISLDYAKLTTPSLAVPGVPTNVAATDGTYTDKTRVTWTAPSSSPGSAATSYKIYRNTTNNSGSATLIASGDTASPYDDTTGVSGTTYYYWVKATNGAGDSAFSSSNSGYRLAPPDAPTGVTATDGTYTDKVRVTWNASSGATSYKIYRHTADSIPASPSWTGITATTYDDTTASDNVTYYYWIKATNSEGDSPASSSNSGYRLDVPAVPTNLAATDGTHADKVALTWTASPTASSYKIYRNTIDSIPGSPLASGVATTSYNDTSATLDVVYYYWVVAVNANGDSAPTASEAGYASAGGVTATVTACIADAVVTVGNVVIPQPNRIWRDIFTTYNPSSSTFHVGMVEMEHTPTPGSGEYSAINAHHFTLSLEDLALHHFVYDDTFPSAFASTTAFTTSERGGAYLDRPESIVAGFWSWGSHPTYNRYPAALLYELSLPYSDEIAPNAAGYPSYVEGSPSQDCWVILPATDYGMVGTLKTLRRVGVWLIPAPDVNDLSIVEVTVIPHPVNAQGGTAEAITETASATGYTAGVTPFQPTRYVYVDFDPSTNPGVSGSVCGEAFEIKIKLTGGIGIRRVMVEVDMGGDIDTVDSQSN